MAALFGPSAPKEGVLSVPPVNEVLALRSQGLGNNQIIEKLQHDGYQVDVLARAFTQADAKGGMAMAETNLSSGGPSYPQNTMSFHASQQQENAHSEALVTERERIEELAEAIIDEKWNELVKSIEKIAEWKDRTESRMDRMEEAVESLKASFSDLHKGVLGKIGDYDRNITDIGSEIKALEKVFQKILPTFTENVNELSRITKNLKER